MGRPFRPLDRAKLDSWRPPNLAVFLLFHPVAGSVSYPDSSPSLWKKTSCDRLSRLIFRTSVSTAFRTLLREEVLVHFTFCQHLKSIFLAVVVGLICMGVVSCWQKVRCQRT